MTSRGGHPDELISASLSGDLTDAERAELDAHLAGCDSCRATLAAFSAERRILSGMPLGEPPRDLPARVRAGIEHGRFAGPWWRRPGSVVPLFASAAVFAAAVLAVVVVGNLRVLPAGDTSVAPSASASVAPSGSAIESVAPSIVPTLAPVLALGPGELGYLSLNGGSLEASRLTFIDDPTGRSIDLGTVSGQPIAAALSPDGRWLAYITQKGETGANEVWALNLGNGDITHLGCSAAAPFTDRLAWSPDSRYLAFTLVGVDLGLNAGCEAPSNGTDVWLLDTTTGQRAPFTSAGNAYAADFAVDAPAGAPQLWVSFAAPEPRSALLAVPGAGSAGSGGETGEQVPGVFLPLFSPDGNRAIFWSGTMTSNGGTWHFSLDGMPQLSDDFRSTGPASPWLGTPLFADLVPVGGEAFASGSFAWGPDSDLVAFWNGAWTGAPESADGTYPGQQDVYVGRISGGLLNAGSRLVRAAVGWVVAVAFASNGGGVAVTIGLPSAGIGDPPSANLEIVPLSGGKIRTIGGGVNPPPWDGPAVFGP